MRVLGLKGTPSQRLNNSRRRRKEEQTGARSSHDLQIDGGSRSLLKSWIGVYVGQPEPQRRTVGTFGRLLVRSVRPNAFSIRSAEIGHFTFVMMNGVLIQKLAPGWPEIALVLLPCTLTVSVHRQRAILR